MGDDNGDGTKSSNNGSNKNEALILDWCYWTHSTHWCICGIL